jgi:hypothetical protein
MKTQTRQMVAPLSKFEATKQKADRLLALNNISPEDLEDLDKLERDYIAEICTQRLAQLNGAERDSFLDKIALIITPVTKSDIWEYNHSAITSAISGYMQQFGSMPTRNAIAEKTGFSRQTVAKHFAAYKKHPEFVAQMEQFQFMVPKVLTNVYRHALKGNIRAARLYFEMVGVSKPQANNTIVNAQNNYIQINNTILSQDNLKQLSADQLNQIESIIRGQRQ